MYFVSGIFILFVLITVLVYYLVPGKYQWVVLLAGNIVFYLWGGPWAGIYLLVTTASTFTAGLLLDKLNIKKKDIPKDDITGAKKNRRLKKSVVAASLLINFGMLFAVKYLDFTIGAFDYIGAVIVAMLALVYVVTILKDLHEYARMDPPKPWKG